MKAREYAFLILAAFVVLLLWGTNQFKLSRTTADVPVQPSVDRPVTSDNLSASAEKGMAGHIVQQKAAAVPKPAPSLQGKEEAGEVQLPQGVSKDWWAEAQKNISEAEYKVSWKDKATSSEIGPSYQAPNRANNLRTYFTVEGIVVVPRTGDADAWIWGLKPLGISEDEDSRPLVNGNRVEYIHGPITEWYINDAKGLEQGFEIKEADDRLVSAGELTIALEVTGNLLPRLSADSQAIDFITEKGVSAVRYNKLKSYDAKGRELASRMALDDEKKIVSLIVNVKDAEYPVIVDPLASTPDQTTEPNRVDDGFGWSVALAGDVNGDGFADVIVGAKRNINYQGAAYIFFGSANGFSATYDWRQIGSGNYYFGFSVAGAGDVNGDGYDDVIVGEYKRSYTDHAGGSVYVYYGSAAGPSQTPDWTGDVNDVNADFGYSVAGAGDVNGDGYADIIIGAPGLYGCGGAFIYYGSADGPSLTPDWSFHDDGSHATFNFGYSVAGAGDINGDGYADIIVGSPNTFSGKGVVFAYHGSASGPSTTPNWTVESNNANAQFGYSVAGAGDVNGDGFADVIVGAPDYFNGQSKEGAAFVFYGSASGLSTAANWSVESNVVNATFGRGVAGLGDINGDGYADIIVKASRDLTNNCAYLYFGSATGPSSTPDWVEKSYWASTSMGVGTGDVNGDGYADLILGDPYYTNGENYEGAVHLFYGSASRPSATPDWSVHSNQASAYLGFTVAGAGDVNGDGYTDVIVGAPLYDSGLGDEGRAYLFFGSAAGLSATPDWTAESDQMAARFGTSVAGAGDVNGDGFGDVIVGAPNYANGQSGEGRAYVFLGSAAGLSATPDWTAESDQMDAWFGTSVAGAGDVNGDGFGDVIVGAHNYKSGESAVGRAYVYYGSSSGLSTLPDWTAESDQANSFFGWSVEGVGDLNGDGFADVVVGAYYYTNVEFREGAAFVYMGSSNGLSSTPDIVIESDREASGFGYSVAGAGDVNGDGFADVIVGAPYYTNGHTEEGAVFLYHGSAGGLSHAPDLVIESDQNYASFGWSVAGAGDVNGDGFADVIAGAPLYTNGQQLEGAAFGLFGSAAGVSPVANWIVESNKEYAYFGWSVAGAGDVNGDGFADVIVGAHRYYNSLTNEGAAFLYYGNSATGRPVSLRQSSTSGSPGAVQPWGATQFFDRLSVSMRATSPYGRCRVKIAAQVCPGGAPFGDVSCITAVEPSWTDVTATSGGVVRTLAVTGLSADTLYKWRSRVLYAPYSVNQNGTTGPLKPFHGPWRRPTAQAFGADLRTAPAYMVTASAGGNGSGHITSNIGGIDYVYQTSNTQTTGLISFGTQVVLTATADADSTASWVGCDSTGGTSTSSTCTINSLGSNRTVTATFASGLIGDVNNDGNINIVDALFVARYAAGLSVSGFVNSAADVNCDGNINIVDALLIARKAAGLAVPSWCP